MKTALIFFKEQNKIFKAEYYSAIAGWFENAGVDIHALDVLSSNDGSAFKRRLAEYKNTVDNLIVFENFDLDFDLREMVAEQTQSAMLENDTARKILDTIIQTEGKSYPDYCALMPIEATVIPNLKGALQGFIYDEQSFTLAVLPMQIEQVKPMCEKYLLPYLDKKSGIKVRRITLKYFGEKNALDQTLELAKKSFDQVFNCCVTQSNGDFTIDLLFDDESFSNDVIRFIVGELKDNIYAEFDTTLGERLFDLLKLRKLKLSTAESFTAGRVVSTVIANPGASDCVHEGIVSYSNDSKKERLLVKHADLVSEGVVSSVVAYQMAVGLLRDTKTDVAIATTGIAGPKSDDTNKPVGLCYIAVGTRKGVHTYRYVFPGNREEITETAKNTALFLAIKLLKTFRG